MLPEVLGLLVVTVEKQLQLCWGLSGSWNVSASVITADAELWVGFARPCKTLCKPTQCTTEPTGDIHTSKVMSLPGLFIWSASDKEVAWPATTARAAWDSWDLVRSLRRLLPT